MQQNIVWQAVWFVMRQKLFWRASSSVVVIVCCWTFWLWQCSSDWNFLCRFLIFLDFVIKPYNIIFKWLYFTDLFWCCLNVDMFFLKEDVMCSRFKCLFCCCCCHCILVFQNSWMHQLNVLCFYTDFIIFSK